MNFLFIRKSEVFSENTFHLPCDSRLERLRASMDLAEDTRFRVVIEEQGRCSATVLSVGPEGLTASYGPVTASEPGPDVDLILAVPRPKVLRRMIPALVSMGVRSISLVNACGVLREYFDTHWLDPAQLDDLVMLGLEQGGVCCVPVILQERLLRPFLEDRVGRLRKGELRLLCAPHGKRGPMAVYGRQRILLAIGPETGWTDFEEAIFEGLGFIPYSLGDEHLACEVAAIGMLGAVKAQASG